jgi:spore maturation protein CgeB
MKVVMFYHSLLSDWNHGNAHFLRGIATELISRGDEVVIYEPEDSWSYQNLMNEAGIKALAEFYTYYPRLSSIRYKKDLDFDKALSGADLVIVHEWNSPELVKIIGQHRNQIGKYKLLFHDTHHRAVTDKNAISNYDLQYYDGVLAFGEVIKNIYLQEKWTTRAWVWHEAADIRVFLPINRHSIIGDLVWVGNWGDEERSEEIIKYLVEPVKKLKLKAVIYGVRYPAKALDILAKAGITYGGWIPNYKVPALFSRYRLTLHIPRRPYITALPGIPTIRPFEAMASGIPLISAKWNDTESLFNSGKDFLLAEDPDDMKKLIKQLLKDDKLSNELSQNGIKTIHSRHTCAHRVDQLYSICKELKVSNLLTESKVA